MELVLVALVLMVSAVIVIAMANSQIGGFGDTVDNQRENVGDNLSDQLSDIGYENPSFTSPQMVRHSSNPEISYTV